MSLQYQDEDGDAILIESDEALVEAVEYARTNGLQALKLSTSTASLRSTSTLVESTKSPVSSVKSTAPSSVSAATTAVHQSSSNATRTVAVRHGGMSPALLVGLALAAVGVIVGAAVSVVKGNKK